MTFQEIIEELKKHGVNISNLAFGNFKAFTANVGAWQKIEEVGGEGEGEHWHSVIYFSDHDIYIKITGFYSSGEGVDFYDGWGCAEEVRPVDKTITVYE